MNIINDNDYCYIDLFWRMIVAFLHFVINSSDNYSVKAAITIVHHNSQQANNSRVAKTGPLSVWTFLSTEKPLSASAFEQGIFKSPDINYKFYPLIIKNELALSFLFFFAFLGAGGWETLCHCQYYQERSIQDQKSKFDMYKCCVELHHEGLHGYAAWFC